MSKDIIYKELDEDEAIEACKMVIDCFNEFVAPGYSAEGIQEFLKFVDADCMRERLLQGNFVIVAKENNSIVGVIEIRSFNHICLLFVDKKHHRKGIAKNLLELAIRKCRRYRNEVRMIEVNSSPYAVPIYEKLGFVRVNSEQLVHGIRFIAMVHKFIK